MATKPLPPNTENLTVNFDKRLKQRIKEQADKTGVSVSEYVRSLLIGAIERDIVVTMTLDGRYLVSEPVSNGFEDDRHKPALTRAAPARTAQRVRAR